MDECRVSAYLEAMQRSIKPGDVVVEIGSGTGFFAMQSCRMGARHVYAIEANDAVCLADKTAAMNGFADRITWIHDRSTNVTLPEQADVMISDLRGVIPLFGHHISSIVDARKRLLKPTGIQIPGRDRIFAVPCETPAPLRKDYLAWDAETHGFDWTVFREKVVNQWCKTRASMEDLLSERSLLFELDYRSVVSPDIDGEVAFTVQRSGTLGGLLLSFETELCDGVGFSTGPEAPEAIYGSAFFPIETPRDVAPGDALRAQFRAQLNGDEYRWTWTTTLNGAVVARQSTMRANVISPRTWRLSAADCRPELLPAGAVARWILERMNGETTIAALAEGLCGAFPGEFLSVREAMSRVLSVVGAYGR